nr:C40 family peptidase [Egicoccus sp.]
MSLVPGRRSPRTVAALVTALLLVVAMVLPAAAQPSSQDLRGRQQDAQSRLDALMMDVAEVVEDYNEAAVALEEAEAARAATAAEHARLSDDVDALTTLAEDYVRRMHKLGPSLELSSIFVSGNPTDAGAKAATLRRVLAGQRADLEDLAAARTAIAATANRLEEQRTVAAERAGVVEARRAELDAMVASQQDEIADLEDEIAQAEAREEAERRRAEEERLRREAEERARQAAEEQRRQAERAPASEPPAPAPRSEASPDPTPSEEPAPAPAPSTRRSAQTAIDTALAQVGKPYRYGGSGPGSFDCSGLTSFAWRAAGVEITRTSRSQYGFTNRISRSELQPGDLVFYGRSVSRISHVAIYLGGTRVVEAPYSGANVRIRGDGMTRNDIVGYGRV